MTLVLTVAVPANGSPRELLLHTKPASTPFELASSGIMTPTPRAVLTFLDGNQEQRSGQAFSPVLTSRSGGFQEMTKRLVRPFQEIFARHKASVWSTCHSAHYVQGPAAWRLPVEGFFTNPPPPKTRHAVQRGDLVRQVQTLASKSTSSPNQ